MRTLIMISVFVSLTLVGCQEQKRMEQAPPKEQQVVMVPSHLEGKGQPQTTPADPKAAESAPLPPGSRPDGPQPGDLDYKGN